MITVKELEEIRHQLSIVPRNPVYKNSAYKKLFEMVMKIPLSKIIECIQDANWMANECCYCDPDGEGGPCEACQYKEKWVPLAQGKDFGVIK